MRRELVLAGLLLASCSPPSLPSSDSLTGIGQGLMGPRGLAATVHASGLKAMSAFDVDSRGRLWVATAAYTPAGNDAVYLVPAAGAAPLKVIAGVNTPLGLAWVGDTLYVSSKERVDAYSALQGTRFTRHKTVVQWPTGVGELNNIVRAPDGRLVVGISAPCDHCKPSIRWSATVTSFKSDGSGLRTDATGIRAPFGLAYYPGTSDLFVSMNQRDDLGQQTPGDWLGVVRRGQAWGFPACYGQGGAACAGVPMPVAVLDRHAAAGGVAIVTGELGQDVGTAALVGEWKLGKVQRVTLAHSGSSYHGAVHPFLSGLQNPLPILLLAGTNALLVGDWGTGTIYRIAAA